MSTNVYSKNDILQKLAQEGFFVDFLTLDSFLAKYKLEAIFEDEDGNEFFDTSVYDTLVQNVLKRPAKEEVQEAYNSAETICAVNDIEIIEDAPYIEQEPQDTVVSEETVVESQGLSDIKWHDWQEVSAAADLPKAENHDPVGLVSIRQEHTAYEPKSEQPEIQVQEEPALVLDEPEIVIDDTEQFQQAQENIEPEIQEVYQEPQELIQEEPQEEHIEPEIETVEQEITTESEISEEPKAQIQEIMTTSEESEDDFDDIGLLSDSIQAQEKFQNYIVNELAKKNIDLTPKIENAFKLDISEKTLNMIARAIAKKIARQVSLIFSADAKNNTKLALIEKKNQDLEQKVSALELQNKKLKLLLVESNKNLNSYKPTFFGLYKFVRNKTPKKKK